MLLIYEFIGSLLDRLTEIHNDLDGHLIFGNQFLLELVVGCSFFNEVLNFMPWKKHRIKNMVTNG